MTAATVKTPARQLVAGAWNDDDETVQGAHATRHEGLGAYFEAKTV